MEESPEQKYDRLQREIQTAILKGFPNPERKGCPGRAVIESYAKDPDLIRAEDDTDETSAWYHISHCSPCYAEFLQLRTEYRVKQTRSRLTRRAAILSSLGSVGVAGWLLSQNRVRTVDIDFDKYISTRGVGEGDASSPPTIPTGKVHFRIKLPKGSAGGLYSVRLSKEPDSEPVFATTATSVEKDGGQVLLFSAHFRADPGSYALAVRGDHRGVWRYSSVSVETR